MLMTTQPVGIFPVPASHLLLPLGTTSEHQQALSRLLLGDSESPLPTDWQFFENAVRGDMDTASQAIERFRQHEPEEPLWKYNAFVLAPSKADYAGLRHELPPPYQSMLDSVAYTYGFIDQLPAAQGPLPAAQGQLPAAQGQLPAAQGQLPAAQGQLPAAQGLDGELLALYLSTNAAWAMERGNPSGARHDLRNAVEACRERSPLLAAILLAQHVELAQSTPGFAPVLLIQEIKEAIRLAEGALNAPFLAGLWSQLGMALQQTGNGERGALLEAIQAYQTALQCGITAERFPEMYAMLQNNLGLCYLAMPRVESSHQLRSGVAVQSFRQALKIYTRELHPDMWASVNMNLANALQYLPSSHPEENLIQAVQTYDEVLEIRSRARDPVAYALVLVNQANALAHLGIFQPALEKVAEAYKLFQWHDQAEQATAARELMEQIHQRLGEISEGQAVSEAST